MTRSDLKKETDVCICVSISSDYSIDKNKDHSNDHSLHIEVVWVTFMTLSQHRPKRIWFISRVSSLSESLTWKILTKYLAIIVLKSNGHWGVVSLYQFSSHV